MSDDIALNKPSFAIGSEGLPHLEAPALYELSLRAAAYREFLGFRRYMRPEYDLKSWWPVEVADHLQDFYEDCKAGLRPKMALMSPPQHGKSDTVIDFAAWLAGREPNWRTIFASYSDSLGVRANAGVGRIMQSDQFKATFPTQIGLPGYQKTTELIEYCNYRGYFRNVTVRGGITGLGLDLGIIDDPTKGSREARSQVERKALWEWFTDDFFDRLSKNAGILIIMTRWHVDDLIGMMKTKFPDMKCLRYPAIAERDEPGRRKKGEALLPSQKPLSFLLEQKQARTEASWQALYQQNPIIVGGSMFPTNKFKTMPEWDASKVKASVRYWDKAGTAGGTGSETAGVLMHQLIDKRFVITSVIHGRWSALEREERIKQTAKLDHATYKNYEIVVEREPGSGGKESAEATIRNLAGFRVLEDRVTGDKETRAEPLAVQVQGGNVYLTGGEWVTPFVEQAEIFPQGKLRDMIDAASGAFNRLTQRARFNTNYDQWSK